MKGIGRTLVAWIAGAMGLVLALAAMLSIYYLATLVETEAEVVAVEFRSFSGSGGHDEWYPTLQYTVGEADVRTYRPPVEEGTGLAAPVAVGDRIEIRYDPRNPDRVRLSVAWSFYLVPVVLLVLGWVLLAGAIGYGRGVVAN